MTKTIKVHQPNYNAEGRSATIKLTDELDGLGEIEIDLESLLPFVSNASDETVDFLMLAAAVYGIDRFIVRRPNSVDGWSREFRVKFPVGKPASWNSIKSKISDLLSFLTGDYWEVEFYKGALLVPSVGLPAYLDGDFKQVNLFSGGLDSLIGAVDCLSKGDSILLASHYDPNMGGPKGDQTALIDHLEQRYQGQFRAVPSVKVFLKDSNLSGKETTLRSRSLVFIALAHLIAHVGGIAKVEVPENGSVSLNFPLSSSRRSACSTRTTHPTLINQVRSIWGALGLSVVIGNSYERLTKGQMVANCRDVETLATLVPFSNSCGKRGHRSHWEKRTATHCGVCMPCVYRQASLMNLEDRTEYGNKINSLWPFDTKKGQDIGACLEFLNMKISEKEIRQELIINGLKDLSNIDIYVDVVKSTRRELKAFISKIGNKSVKKKAGIL